MALSPWDLRGLGFDWNYRPRRESYLFATRLSRRRNESYRGATRSREDSESSSVGPDFIDATLNRRKRKQSYVKAMQLHSNSRHHVTVHRTKSDMDAKCDLEGSHQNYVNAYSSRSYPALQVPEITITPSTSDEEVHNGIHVSVSDSALNSTRHVPPPPIVVPKAMSLPNGGPSMNKQSTAVVYRESPRVVNYKKNLIIINAGFILIFTAFRAIQNLESSLNSLNSSGTLSMAALYLMIFFSCPFAPLIVNKLSAKWTILLGLIGYQLWIITNMFPHLVTLIPSSLAVGAGQSIAWCGEVIYITTLVTDHIQSRDNVQPEKLQKYNGFFLAGFQSTHIWGNLVASLVLDASSSDIVAPVPTGNDTSKLVTNHKCGVFDTCPDMVTSRWVPREVTMTTEPVVNLMGVYLALTVTGFLLILLFLDRIDARPAPGLTASELIRETLQCLSGGELKIYRLLIPMLLFNGFEQGFIYADFTKSFVKCELGIQNIGYCMILMGIANVFSSLAVAQASKNVPREAIIGAGTILHMGVMVFMIMWIPTEHDTWVFFVIAGVWGVCDAVWQTQCNYLIMTAYPDDHEMALCGFRMIQSLGAATGFFLSAFVCIDTKLYMIMVLLTVAIMFYVIAEYKLKQLTPDDHVSEITPTAMEIQELQERLPYRQTTSSCPSQSSRHTSA